MRKIHKAEVILQKRQFLSFLAITITVRVYKSDIALVPGYNVYIYDL